MFIKINNKLYHDYFTKALDLIHVWRECNKNNFFPNQSLNVRPENISISNLDGQNPYLIYFIVDIFEDWERF